MFVKRNSGADGGGFEKGDGLLELKWTIFSTSSKCNPNGGKRRPPARRVS